MLRSADESYWMCPMPKKYLFAIIVWSATLAATGALAEISQAPVEIESRSAATQRDFEEAAIRSFLEQFRATRIPLSKAMAIAEHLHNGSRTADIIFEISGSPAYRVRTVKNDRIWENVIDAATGKTVAREVSSTLKELDREDLGNVTALKRIGQQLSDAVRFAEKAASGSAVAGGLIRLDGKPNFVVVIASGDQLKEVTLKPPKIGRKGSAHHDAQ
jgi:uncharacterized membrane protein YkoI